MLGVFKDPFKVLGTPRLALRAGVPTPQRKLLCGGLKTLTNCQAPQFWGELLGHWLDSPAPWPPRPSPRLRTQVLSVVVSRSPEQGFSLPAQGN